MLFPKTLEKKPHQLCFHVKKTEIRGVLYILAAILSFANVKVNAIKYR